MTDRIEQLRKLFAADPADADLPYMIGLELAKAGSTEDAIAWLDRALATDAGHLYAYYQKAKLLGEAGRLAEALAAADLGLARARAAGDAKAAGEMGDLRAGLAD